jgi:acyl-lipid omega-6 desaturase (Delta-12 desaturase)
MRATVVLSIDPRKADEQSAVDLLGKDEYLALKRALMTRPNTLASLAVLLMMAILAAVGLWLAGRSWPEFLLSQLLLAVFFFQGFALLHECGHSTASSRPWVNVVIGHVASVVCFLPFYPWRFIHQQHHLWAGNLDRDPVLAAIRRWRAARKVPQVLRWAWRSWIPLLAVVQQMVFWMYPLRLARMPQTDRRQLVRCAISVLFLIAVYGVLIALAGPFLHPRRFVLAVIIFLAAEEAVNLPHHVGAPVTNGRLPPWQQWMPTRSCRYPRGVSEFLVLNFNFHIEHHVFPFLPWYRLRSAHHLLRRSLGGAYQEEVGIGWALRNRRQSLDSVIEPQGRCPADFPSPLVNDLVQPIARPEPVHVAHRC